jgi:hypothetical protein
MLVFIARDAYQFTLIGLKWMYVASSWQFMKGEKEEADG